MRDIDRKTCQHLRERYWFLENANDDEIFSRLGETLLFAQTRLIAACGELIAAIKCLVNRSK